MSGAARRPMVAGNWKMNTTVPEGIELARAIVALDRPPGVEVAVLPPFTHLWPVCGELRGTGIELGAQDFFWEDAGAYTGEVSPAALAGWCDLVLVGHSERRHLLGETDEQVARKLRRALTHPLRVILAVGETLEQRDRRLTLGVCHGQLDAALAGVDAAGLERIVVAYEPVWAIGTGRTATPEQAQEVCAAIRTHVAGLVSAAAAAALVILYGGSVTAENAASLFAEPDIDGGLIGGASLKPQAFGVIVAAAATTANATGGMT
jgi:triosephosphate isomerase